MKEFLEKLKLVLSQLERANGEIFLFALFLRDNPLDLWDLVVAGPWLKSEDLEALKTVCAEVQECLTGNEIIKLSHVVILNQNDPTVTYLREIYNVSSGQTEEIANCEDLSDHLNFTIKKAYLLRCISIEDELISK
jgi:hypothetical protein